ncbi:hypothetical protein Acr_06g0010590 [Actinidia rufa]|uniref:Uncharacterized protein n=1 Tax=Actinidia rufa TaxID=165716 RepID=A0A7J0ESZ2_9ERIC|nr:hypothetical protein Acr_06g0010590 [Actinidia rufa]
MGGNNRQQKKSSSSCLFSFFNMFKAKRSSKEVEDNFEGRPGECVAEHDRQDSN